MYAPKKEIGRSGIESGTAGSEATMLQSMSNRGATI